MFKRRFDYESRLSTMCAGQYFTTCYQIIERASEPSDNDQTLGSISKIYILLTDFWAQNLGPIHRNVNVMSKSQRYVKHGEASIKVNANNCTDSVRSFAFNRELIIKEKNVKRFSSVAGNEERAWTCDGKCEG